MSTVAVRVVEWAEAQRDIRSIRKAVFIEEQGVPAELDLDDLDRDCLHVLACDEQGQPIGTARMREDGKIGRMAVLKPRRGRGVGRALLQALLKEAGRRRLSLVYLASQIQEIGFYEKHGFQITGDIFLDASIPHRNMTLKLLLNSKHRYP